MSLEDVQSAATSRVRALVTVLQRENFTGMKTLSDLIKLLQVKLCNILGVEKVSIAVRHTIRFPQNYHLQNIEYIRYPILDDTPEIENVLRTLSLGIAISCCPKDFIASIDPTITAFHTFCSENPWLCNLALEIFDTLPPIAL